ncbi:TPA: hypothetical protein G9W58_001278 [Salmonella enterica subsp. enterica serovar Typhimurium]|nr:hypothetical protein [Salmonella enterica subsp. enterica serovar Typhimurium]
MGKVRIIRRQEEKKWRNTPSESHLVINNRLKMQTYSNSSIFHSDEKHRSPLIQHKIFDIR